MLLIVSQVNLTTTAPPMTLVCSMASPNSITVTMASTSVCLGASGQPHHCATLASNSPSDAFSGICQLCHGSSSG